MSHQGAVTEVSTLRRGHRFRVKSQERRGNVSVAPEPYCRKTMDVGALDLAVERLERIGEPDLCASVTDGNAANAVKPASPPCNMTVRWETIAQA